MLYNEKADFKLHKEGTDALFDLLERHGIPVNDGVRVLDVGGGQCMHAGYLAQRFGTVYCTDIINYTVLYEGRFAQLLHEKYLRNRVQVEMERLVFLQDDAMNMVFRDGLFDLVASFNSFEHIPDPGRALHEMIRVCRPGGHVFVTFDPIWTADTGSHFFHRVPEPWAHLVLEPGEYIARMEEAGAEAWEVEEYHQAMNRWRLADFERLFGEAERSHGLTRVAADSWAGVDRPEHSGHGNLSQLVASGAYTEAELLTRGLRYLMHVPTGGGQTGRPRLPGGDIGQDAAEAKRARADATH
jgi:ubiquinone/menaquinone biosynthesis C-methylase UbiE